MPDLMLVVSSHKHLIAPFVFFLPLAIVAGINIHFFHKVATQDHKNDDLSSSITKTAGRDMVIVNGVIVLISVVAIVITMIKFLTRHTPQPLQQNV